MATQPQEHWRKLLLRTEETASAYDKALLQEPKTEGVCRLCVDSNTIHEFTHWRWVPNRFPYDRYFSRSEMLITKRHTDENGLTPEECAELLRLKQTILGEHFDLILENLPKQQSIPGHYHVHLVTIQRAQ